MHKEIIEQLEGLGFDAPADEVLDKCVELCYQYNLDAQEFVDQWIAFSVTNLDCTDPTIQYLLDFERRDLIPRKGKENNTNSTKKKLPNSMHLNDQIPTYNNLPGTLLDDSNNDELDDVVDTYCKTPKASKSHVARTPARQNDALFTPVSYSPISGTPRTHSKNAGRILCTFGNSNLIKDTTWSSTKHEKIILKHILTHNGEPLNTKCKFMCDNLTEKIYILHDRLLDIGKGICMKVFGDNEINYDVQNADVPSQEVIKTIGRICSDYDDGKLTSTSVILIGLSINDSMRKDMYSRPIYLNFNNVKSFGIFPGQTVMISGTNPRGETIFVENLFTERMLKSPTPPMKLEKELKFVIASGPFTNDDDLVYEPLNDLISYCKNNKPNVLLLLGPFIEAEHYMITGNILAESFESFLEKMITGIVEALGEDTTVCLVSSQKDITSNCVYPTPPPIIKKSYSNVHLLPDPCIIDINGITIGATSTDIVKHLLEEELSVNAGDKVKRVVNYLLHQGSFYPLEPPSLEVCVDSDLASKYAKIEITPNILILPSDQKYFIRDIEKCLAINPGRLISSTNEGSFTRLIVSPPTSEDVNTSSYVFGQIMKI